MGNSDYGETPLLDDALRSVAALLPPRWALRVERPEGPHALFADAVVTLIAPTGLRTRIAVEVKRSGNLPVTAVLNTLRNIRLHNDLPVLFASDYIGPSLRSALEADDFSYADSTGWVRLAISDPPVLLTARGAAKPLQPRRDAAVRRLDGAAVNRTICALVDATMPIGVRELAGASGSSPGSVAKLLATITDEGITDRDERGAVTRVRKRALVERWARDYSFAKANDDVRYCIAPRGLTRTLDTVRGGEAPYALTGWAAAREVLPPAAVSVVPLRLLALYTRRGRDAEAAYGLIPAEPAIANVVLAVPQDPRIVASPDGAPRLAPLALIVVDLLTLPGRGDSEAEQLMDFLARSDPAWGAS